MNDEEIKRITKQELETALVIVKDERKIFNVATGKNLADFLNKYAPYTVSAALRPYIIMLSEVLDQVEYVKTTKCFGHITKYVNYEIAGGDLDLIPRADSFLMRYLARRMSIRNEIVEYTQMYDVEEAIEDTLLAEIGWKEVSVVEEVPIKFYYYTIYAGRVYQLSVKRNKEEFDTYCPLVESPKLSGVPYFETIWPGKLVECPIDNEGIRLNLDLEIRVQVQVKKLTNFHTEAHYEEATYSIWSEIHHGPIADQVIAELKKKGVSMCNVYVFGDGHGLFANRGVSHTSTIKKYPHTNLSVQEADMNSLIFDVPEDAVLVFLYVSSFLTVQSIQEARKHFYVEVDESLRIGNPGYVTSSNVIDLVGSEGGLKHYTYMFTRNSLEAYPIKPGMYTDYQTRMAYVKEGRYYPLVEHWTDLPDYEKKSFYYAPTGRVQHGIPWHPGRLSEVETRTVYRLRTLEGFPKQRIKQCIRGQDIRCYLVWPDKAETKEYVVKQWKYKPTPKLPFFKDYLLQERQNGNVLPAYVIKAYWSDMIDDFSADSVSLRKRLVAQFGESIMEGFKPGKAKDQIFRYRPPRKRVKIIEGKRWQEKKGSQQKAETTGDQEHPKRWRKKELKDS